MACRGLTEAALPNECAGSFQQLCKVVGSKWGVVSADTLFNLLHELPKNDASAAAAFVQILTAVSVPAEVAVIIAHAHRMPRRTAAVRRAGAAQGPTWARPSRQVTAVACPRSVTIAIQARRAV